MLNDGMSQLKWHLLRQAEKFGVLGVMALLLMLVVLIGYVCFVLPARQALVMAEAIPVVNAEQENNATNERSLQTQITAFTGSLPQQAQKTNQIERIISIAKAEALVLSAVNYQSKQAQAMLQTDMKFSAQSDYPKLKRFMNEVLYQMPNVSLKTLRMQRTRSDKPFVKSTVHLTLYFRTNDD